MSKKTWMFLALGFLLLPLPGKERTQHLNPLFAVRDGDGEVFLQRPSQPVILDDQVVVKDGEALLVLNGSGHLVQRMDARGELKGSFRLKLPGLAHPLQLKGRPLAVDGNRLVWIWKDGEGEPVISAYALVSGRS